ncbi:MAG TPA: hypothetical protein VF590_22695 [Isosphaeraceae bacterium]
MTQSAVRSDGSLRSDGRTSVAAPNSAAGGRPTGPVGRDDLAAAVACCAAGLLLAVLPHLVSCWELGQPVWIADWDELGFYLPVGSRAYHDHPASLSDPSHILGPRDINIYSRVQMVPGIIAARVMGLGPLGIGLAWRAWAGLSAGLAWYLVLRRSTPRPAAAAALALVPLGDAGLLHGRLLAEPVALALRLAAGRPGALFDTAPTLLPHWRIVNPALGMAPLLLYVWLLLRARERPDGGRLIAAGLGLGLLFYVYFYYWTAAVPGLLLAFALDPGCRWIYARIGLIGVLVGLPEVVSSIGTRRQAAPDWPARVDVFYPVPRFTWPTLGRGYLLELLVLAACLVWIRARRRDLIGPWSLAVAGLAMVYHHVVTGLQMQNFHFHYVSGPILSLVLLLIAAPGLSGHVEASRGWALGLWCLVVLHLALAVGFRALEATRSGAPRANLATYRKYRAQRIGAGSPRLDDGAVVAGAADFIDFAVVLENQRPLAGYSLVLSPSADDAEVDERETLNQYLLGCDRPAFAAQLGALDRAAAAEQARGPRVGPGFWSRVRDPRSRARMIAARLACYDAIRADPTAALNRWRVRHLALPTGQEPPPDAGGDWTLLQRGPFWWVWRRTARSGSI